MKLIRRRFLEPNLAEAVYNMGLAFKEQGEREKSIKTFERVIKIDPLTGVQSIFLIRYGEINPKKQHQRNTLKDYLMDMQIGLKKHLLEI